MPKKAKPKIEPPASTNTLSDSEREGLDVKNNENKIRLQAKGVYFGLIVFTIVLVAAGATWLVRSVFFPPKAERGHVVFTVNDKKFYSEDIEAMQADASLENVDGKTALDIIIDAETRRAAAESLGIQVPDNKLLNATSNWQKEHSYPTALDSVVKQDEVGGYSVAVFYLPFSRLQYPPNGLNTNNKPEGWRNAQAIASDRSYAEAKAKTYHERLSNKEITTDQAISEIREDERLSSGPSSNKSVAAVVDENGDVMAAGQARKIDENGWMADVKKLTPGQYSEIKVGKITLFDQSNSPEVDGYFYFVGLDKKIDAQPGISNQLNEAIKQVKVVRK